MACTCRAFRAAHSQSWWPELDTATGSVLEPRSGRFAQKLSPGDNVQSAVDACPTGGCILLRPGNYSLAATARNGPAHEPHTAGLWVERDVALFGRGMASVAMADDAPHACVMVMATNAPRDRPTLDGIFVRSALPVQGQDDTGSEAGALAGAPPLGSGCFVLIRGGLGSARLQACDFSSVCAEVRGASPKITGCRCEARPPPGQGPGRRGRGTCACAYV